MIQLPIDSYLSEIVNRIVDKDSVIITASPGSGKTTRIPIAVLNEYKKKNINKKIIVLVPKRIAAVSASLRVCDENNLVLGESVGYSVRFENKCEAQTQLIYMTEGTFLKKISDSSFYQSIGCIFFDEFHERRSYTDLLIGLSLERKILENDIQIVVMSATLDTQLLEQFLGKTTSQINIDSPPFKIEKNYQKQNQRLNCDHIFFDFLKLSTTVAWQKSKKDILIFLPGKAEMNKAFKLIQPLFPHIPIHFLHGSLSIEEQKKMISFSGNRRIILSTNVAESSITVPNIDCVIDSGLEKNVHTEKKMGFKKLTTQRISLFSAKQREGRAARTQDGYVFKMWHESDELSMAKEIRPEILNSSLIDELLILALQGLTDFKKFSWITPPLPSKIDDAVEQLKKWKLLDRETTQITELGRLIIESPINIQNSLYLIELVKKGHPAEQTCQFLAQIENINLNESLHHYQNDLERILDTPLNEQAKKLKQSLLQYVSKIKIQSSTKKMTLYMITLLSLPFCFLS